MKRKWLTSRTLTMSLAFSLSLGLTAFSTSSAIVQASAAPAVGTTTINDVTNVHAGSTVTISGVTNAAEVIIKVLQPDGIILFFDIVQASDSRYTDSFTLPSTAAAGSQYQIIVGSGSDVAVKSFTIKPSSGGSSPSTPVTPAQPGDNSSSSLLQFEASDVIIPASGPATLDATKGDATQATLSLPASVTKVIDGKSLQITLPSGALTLPSGVLRALASLSGSDTDAKITLQYKRLSSSEALASVTSAGQAGTGLVPQGEVLELVLGVQLADGTVRKLTTFSDPVTITLQLSENATPLLSGIYYISDQGTIAYIGGTVQGDAITASVSHFSKYGVFSYTKAYADIASSYWAADVIAALTAKHIVQGMTSTTFGPKADVSRAEFVTMIARALNLKAASTAPFSDVKAGSWYAESAAAAYEQGIITGTGANLFEPNKPITREEMAVIIAHVYENQIEHADTGGTDADIQSFQDSGTISSWAKEAVQTVVHEKLMIGSDHRFYPRNHATRAEAAQVLYNLLFRG
ncbi:S-layer homology domain-containing protein [Paenibacillus albus]|uniref:SLH domain-containing protein n=1 Tax=Paenibacillus albus TaxID=2495582 RepID=A0A3Q8X4W1_9BACL|nr:S-layer homology domain-containing protein [Paenibacillus albus]AZN40128.1 hypothetical protein EJC50_11050 [Paenibacillus albus]